MDLSSLASLPPLQGKLVNVKSSVEFTSFNLSDYITDHGGEDDVSQIEGFNVNDGEEAVKCLRRCFQILEPGHHIARRMPDHGGSGFIHCRQSASLGRRYYNLRFHLEERARVELLRDSMFRLKTAVIFVKDLEDLVKEEFQSLQSVTHDCVSQLPTSKIFCLSSLCEDLRTLIGHWNCIKQKLHTNRWLQPVLGSMYFQLEKVKLTLRHLQNKAIWWLEKFVIIGFQVFAHCNVETVSREMISNLTRGVEDLNKIINSLQNRHSLATSTSSIQSYAGDCLNMLNPKRSNSVSCLGEHVRAIPFSRLLTILATERSKYAALAAHRFFTTSLEFVKLLYSGRLPEYIWTDEGSHGTDKSDRDTSDYHTATGSMTSLSAAILKVGSLRAPDLSELESPLIEIARREQIFAEDFVDIVCNNSGLLRKNDSSEKSRKGLRYSHSVSSGKPPRSDTPVLSRNDSLRKSVSWGDSDLGSTKTSQTSRYLDRYWGQFGTSLYMMFYEPSWVRQNSLYFSEIGSMIMLNTTVIALIKHMIQHVCLKVTSSPSDKDPSNQSGSSIQIDPPSQSDSLYHIDPPSQSGPKNMRRHPIDPCYPDPGMPIVLPEPIPDIFPQGSVTPMLNAARKCLHTAAFSAWDTLMCEALASHRTDKCYPCPLVNGDYSTRTGMILRDTYQPMLHLLKESLLDSTDPFPGGLPASLDEVIAVATRLVSTSNVSVQWCRTKTHQYLQSSSVGTFLLISQTDLKMLVDETKTCIYNTQVVSKSLSRKVGAESVVCLNTIINQLSVLMDSLQSLSGICMKQFSRNLMDIAMEYFKANMPTGKVWKKKADSAMPKDHNMYIEHALETILEPVLEGVGKLKQTVQLSVISIATEALCQAWMSFILQEKIKFSYLGACQLGLDVRFMSSWLHQSIVMESVQQSILDLAVLKTLAGVVLLLMKQPYSKRSSSKVRSQVDTVDDHAMDYIQGERTVYEAEDKISHVPNPNEWLALRVSGSGRSWRGISSCLNPDPQ